MQQFYVESFNEVEEMTTLDHLIRIRAQHPIMSLASLALLLHIHQEGPVTDYTECAQRLKTPGRSIICRAACYLEASGLITNKIQTDKRRVKLEITEKGRELVEGME